MLQMMVLYDILGVLRYDGRVYKVQSRATPVNNLLIMMAGKYSIL